MTKKIVIEDELIKIIGTVKDAKMDVQEVAVNNNATLINLFKKLSEEIGKTVHKSNLSTLLGLMENWTLSLHINFEKVIWICTNGRLCTTYDIAKSKAELEDISFDESLKKVCQDYYARRIKFNSAIKKETHFKYSALTIGGSGLFHFGEFCLQFKHSTIEKLTGLVFLKNNSLDYYFDSQHELDLEKLKRDLSTKEAVKHLAILKHIDRIKNNTLCDNWQDEICCPKSYIEGLIIDDLNLSDLECVKIEKKLDTIYSKIGLDVKYLVKVKPALADMVTNYFDAKEILETQSIKIIEV